MKYAARVERSILSEEKKPPESIPAAFLKSGLPTVGNLRQLLFDASERSAQFLATIVGSTLVWHLSQKRPVLNGHQTNCVEILR